MSYYPDFSGLDLRYLERRLTGVEPIPSQLALRENLGPRLAALRKAGIHTCMELLAAVKTPKARAELSLASGIDGEYLALLKRFLEGQRPKPHPLSEFSGIDPHTLKALAARDMRSTAELFDALQGAKDLAALAKELGIGAPRLTELYELSDLCRIQWVGPSYALLLRAAGYKDPRAIAKADPETLRSRVCDANASLGISKVNIGLKDSARLVALAGFVADERAESR